MHDDAGWDNGLLSNPPREQCETSEGGGGDCIILSPVSIVVRHRLEWADSTTSARRAAKEGGSPPTFATGQTTRNWVCSQFEYKSDLGHLWKTADVRLRGGPGPEAPQFNHE